MTCDACLEAERNPRAAMMRNGCDSCTARALATTALRSSSCDKELEALFRGRLEAGRRLLAHWRRVLVEVRS